MQTPRLETATEVHAARTFAEGLVVDVVRALKVTAEGELFAVIGPDGVGADLEAWSRMTGNAIIGRTHEGGHTRWVLRRGAPMPVMGTTGSSTHATAARRLGARLWLYTNFDCNLSCDYCCVRSSPAAPRRELGLETIRSIAEQAPELGVEQFLVTGGEPMLLDDIGAILRVLTAAAPTTILTNGALLKGSRLSALRELDRARLVFQISLDSPTPDLHDLHRGAGTWERAIRAIDAVRALGFRVRIAATVSTTAEEQRFVTFLDARGVGDDDRVIRRVARRGLADAGVALGRVDIVPEITITREGVFWHPLGADDDDLFVTREILPLADAFDAVHRTVLTDGEHGRTLASVFHCA